MFCFCFCLFVCFVLFCFLFVCLFFVQSQSYQHFLENNVCILKPIVKGTQNCPTEILVGQAGLLSYG